jgi:hypothetical protein
MRNPKSKCLFEILKLEFIWDLGFYDEKAT